MIKYARIINQEKGLCEVGLGTNIGFYESIGMTELDVTQSEKDGNWYLSSKCPHYTPEEIENKEQERINMLTMTSLDFINVVKSAGITDEEIEEFLNAHLNLKHQLQFCQNVYCGVAKSLTPVTIGNKTITPEMVEQAFIRKYSSQQ